MRCLPSPELTVGDCPERCCSGRPQALLPCVGRFCLNRRTAAAASVDPLLGCPRATAGCRPASQTALLVCRPVRLPSLPLQRRVSFPRRLCRARHTALYAQRAARIRGGSLEHCRESLLQSELDCCLDSLFRRSQQLA
ncbi:hypothetical protein VFPBJ_06483 [Purpureocillium lilacinum]|uniref:Uncharacterized protein n=1 Tax=Purpureocillium lilacinum TaxID=33203 RepID=A0A179GKN0_PURLI|nr:hypothetical protein VFPBJ_06483 [Purpureocillium lilacinum]